MSFIPVVENCGVIEPRWLACHCAFDGSRLRAFAHAACDRNHVPLADRGTPGTLTARVAASAGARVWQRQARRGATTRA